MPSTRRPRSRCCATTRARSTAGWSMSRPPWSTVIRCCRSRVRADQRPLPVGLPTWGPMSAGRQRPAKLVGLTSEPLPTDNERPHGRVWLRDEDPREGAELVFDFPFDEDLHEAVKRLPRRWFDWRRKHWRVPADARIGKLVAELLGRFPNLEAAP